MSFKIKTITLRGKTHFKPASTSNGGGTGGGSQDEGYIDRTSTGTYTGDTKVNTVYPTGTKIVSGEFDDSFPGYQDKTFTVTDTSTFNDLINAFNGFFQLSGVDANGDPVDTFANPDTPFYLKGHSTDGGLYDLVYMAEDGFQYHADSFFGFAAAPRRSRYDYPYLSGNGGGGAPGVENDRVGTIYLHRSDLLSTVTASNGTRHIRLGFYVDATGSEIESYTFDVYNGGGSATVGDMLDFFSTRRSNLAATLQLVPGTSTNEEINNTEGYLHIAASLAYFTFNEQDADFIGFGAPSLFGSGL